MTQYLYLNYLSLIDTAPGDIVSSVVSLIALVHPWIASFFDDIRGAFLPVFQVGDTSIMSRDSVVRFLEGA